jgi:hypothetical protein
LFFAIVFLFFSLSFILLRSCFFVVFFGILCSLFSAFACLLSYFLLRCALASGGAQTLPLNRSTPLCYPSGGPLPTPPLKTTARSRAGVAEALLYTTKQKKITGQTVVGHVSAGHGAVPPTPPPTRGGSSPRFPAGFLPTFSGDGLLWHTTSVLYKRVLFFSSSNVRGEVLICSKTSLSLRVTLFTLFPPRFTFI